MSRSARLLDLIQILRRHRQPVSGRNLAQESGVSLRTLYRDIEALRGQGARIDGEAGLGYVLRPGFLLPPLMFDADEAEALALGLRFVAAQGDEELTRSAESALAKLAAVMPAERAALVEDSALVVPPRHQGFDLADIRLALREERVAEILYRDAQDEVTARRIWPVLLGFFNDAPMLAAFCLLRGDFRHFRLDRIMKWDTLADKYPRRRRTLEREWRASEGL